MDENHRNMREHTKKLPSEVLLHGIVVADEDVPTDGLTPRQGLRRRKSLEPLIHALILVVVVVAAATTVLPIRIVAAPLLELPILAMLDVVAVLAAALLVGPFDEQLLLVLGKDAIVEVLVRRPVRGQQRRGGLLLVLVVAEKGRAGGAAALAAVIVEALGEARAQAEVGLPAIVEGVEVGGDFGPGRPRRRGVGGVGTKESAVEVATLLEPLGRPDGVADRKVAEVVALETQLVAELPKLPVLHRLRTKKAFKKKLLQISQKVSEAPSTPLRNLDSQNPNKLTESSTHAHTHTKKIQDRHIRRRPWEEGGGVV